MCVVWCVYIHDCIAVTHQFKAVYPQDLIRALHKVPVHKCVLLKFVQARHCNVRDVIAMPSVSSDARSIVCNMSMQFVIRT